MKAASLSRTTRSNLHAALEKKKRQGWLQGRGGREGLTTGGQHREFFRVLGLHSLWFYPDDTNTIFSFFPSQSLEEWSTWTISIPSGPSPVQEFSLNSLWQPVSNSHQIQCPFLIISGHFTALNALEGGRGRDRSSSPPFKISWSVHLWTPCFY